MSLWQAPSRRGRRRRAVVFSLLCSLLGTDNLQKEQQRHGVALAWIPSSSSTTTTTTRGSRGPLSSFPSSSSTLTTAPSRSASSLTTRYVASTTDDIANEMQQQQQQQQQTQISFPELGEDGIYHILNKEQHEVFVQANQDKLIVLKVFAPWCRACKGLQPKFQAVAHDEKYQNLPIVWADLSVQHNKEFVKTIGVLALPTVQFYVGGSLADTFPCGPSKVPILKRKLVQLVNDHVDPQTRQVKASSLEQAKIRGSSSSGSEMANDTETGSSSTATAPRPSDSDTELNAGTTRATSTTSSSTPGESIGQRTASSSSYLSSLSSKNATTDSSTSAPGWKTADSAKSVPAPLISLHDRLQFRKAIPHLASLSIADFDRVMDEAKLLTFDAGSVILRQGKPGRTFYIIKEGEVEICQKTFAEDPLQSSGWYLGTVVNRLLSGDYFGERSLLTGEPRAASIRAVEPTSLYALDKDSFPMSSPLSGHTRFSPSTSNDWIDQADEKYGVNFAGLYSQEIESQIQQASVASQKRGSIHTPGVIRGVDTDDDVDWDAMMNNNNIMPGVEGGVTAMTPSPTSPSSASSSSKSSTTPELATNNESVFQLLRRFKMIRQVSKCFDYIATTGAQWGEVGSRTRRAMLVNRLSTAERQEFSDTFELIDQDKSGVITLLELKRVMESVGDHKTDDELRELIAESCIARPPRPHSEQAAASLPGLTKDDFLGIMAEAEFYYLFQDIFKTLDYQDSGYVKAGDLDRVLSGTRDLISDDRKSIINIRDEDDYDMLIDYEQFSRMLLGL